MEGSALGVWVAHGEGNAHAVVHMHTVIHAEMSQQEDSYSGL